MSDQLYPRDGDTYFIPPVPEDVQDADKEDKKKVQEAKPFVKDTLDWFTKQADECNRMTLIDTESKVPVESQIIAYQELAKLLELKKGEYQSYLAELER